MKRAAVLLCSTAVLLGLSSSPVAAAGLSGTFRTTLDAGPLSGTWTIKFSHGNYKVTQNGSVGVRGKYKVSGSRVRLTDKSGSLACRPTGTYRFRRSGRSLRFTRVSDSSSACSGRILVLTGRRWLRTS